MRSGGRFLLYLVWVSSTFTLAVYIFTSGFLLQRQVLSNETICKERGCKQPPTVFNKAVILVIDALKYEFCRYNNTSGAEGGGTSHQTNRLPLINSLVTRPDPTTGSIHGQLFRFIADPPTTTMQRLKGLTTGSLPTFIDVSANFASYKIDEDSLLNQFKLYNKTVFFAGDDTWVSLYPESFSKSDPQPSFDVWDLDTVDNAVKKFIFSQLEASHSWDVLIGHFLGVDHAGHKFGPNHPEMGRKLTEMNSMLETVVSNLPKDTVLFVMGDHGMTSSGDHGGDSLAEVEAALFVYGKKLSFNDRPHGGSTGRVTNTSAEHTAVSQVDLVPTLALLLGIPVPFSNLGMLIDELFIPTMLLEEEGGKHSKLTSFSQDDLVNFRMSYIKSNVHQVHRYLTAYLAAGGHFPEKLNSNVRKLASEVMNRPGALSPRDTRALYTKCKQFLNAAKRMCQAVWVNFDDLAITIGLTLMVLHLSILCLVVCKPQARLLSTLISGFLLICIGCSILAGSMLGASLAVVADLFDIWSDSLPSMEALILYSAGFFALLANGMCLLWKLRYCVRDMLTGLVTSLTASGSGGVDGNPGPALVMYFFISCSVFSNSFVIEEWRVVCFSLVSLLLIYTIIYPRNISGLVTLLILLSVGLARLSCVYVRCREEDGPDCQLTQFHKPLSTLDNNESGVLYRNQRYAVTLLSLFTLCVFVHSGLSAAGNLNGISCAVLTAKYLPWIISVLMASYWALQSFKSPLVVKLLPWQNNILAQLVFGLAAGGILLLVVTPRLVYLQTRSRGPSLMRPLLARQDNIPSYFNYMKANWRTSQFVDSQMSAPLGYGLGSCLSAPYLTICVFLLQISMLVAGDGQCPAVLVQFLLMLAVLVLSAHTRLKQRGASLNGMLRVPFPYVLLWTLIDYLAFFTTGHQATFPHIQWSAAFIGLEGSQIGGSSYSGHILPALLVGWNTFSSSLLSALLLPLLLLAPFPLYLLMPTIRPTQQQLSQQEHQSQSGSGTGGSGMLSGGHYLEMDKGEFALLDKAEDTKSALISLYMQYILIKGLRLCCYMLSAAVLRRHLMVWKIFAPRFIFEALAMAVSLTGLLIGYVIFLRVLSVVTNSYAKSKIS